MTEKIFITGGSGLLGVNWAVAMRDSHKIILGLNERDVSLEGVRTQKIDLESVEHITKAFEESGATTIVHAAGFTNVELCEENQVTARQVNINLANNVAKASAQMSLPLIHISTDHLHSGRLSMQNEGSTLSPMNVYGQTKAEAETYVLESNPSALVLRTNFFCWGTSYRHSFSDRIIASLRAGKKLKLFTDVYYTPILAEALANAAHDLVKLRVSGVVNIVGDERISKYHFGVKVAKAFGLDANLIIPNQFSDHVGLVQRPLDMSLLNHKACQLLGRKLGNVAEHLSELNVQEKNGRAREIGML